jgi:hypothetical protein
MKETKIPQFDEFFTTASTPLVNMVTWNNELCDMLFKFRELGADIRASSTADAPPPSGYLKIAVANDVITPSITKKDGSGIEAKDLDKATQARLGVVNNKIKLLNKRLVALKKREGLSGATYKVKDSDPTQLELSGDASVLEKAKNEECVVNLRRSLGKFNNRTALLVMQLQGNITLAECVTAVLTTFKEELKKKAKEIKFSISEEGVPKIEGIPEKLEDFLPELVVRGYNLFKQLLDYVTNLKDTVPALKPDIERAMNDAKELPKQATTVAKEAGLGLMDTFRAIKYTGANVKTFGAAPNVLAALSKTIADVLLEIAGSVEKLMKQ